MSNFKYYFAFLISFTLFTNVAAQQKSLRILSYNVLKGLQGDSLNMNQFNRWIKEKAPDIVFYQEMNGFSQQSLENFAKGYGHPYAVLAKENGYPVAITSRFPIVNVQKVLDNMWHGYIYANINGLHAFAIHFSPFLYKKRLEEADQILAHAATLPPNEPVIIAGDFNSYQARDSVRYTQKALLSQQNREKRSTTIRNLNNNKFDYSVVDKFTKSNYTDAVNLFSTKFDYTMPTKNYDAPFKQKIRIDYIWLNKTLKKKVSSAEVIYDGDTAEMSDHYPIILDLEY